jgi:predicted NAD/FAD-binding protein
VRIAIVGAGISGLATAHLLHQRHEITVFEAGPRPGGHANTVRVDTEDATYRVDTGFIVFNDRNYPRFEKLLAALKVPSQPSDMSFGVSDGGDFEYTGSSPNGLFAKRSHLVTPWFHRMVADLVRFNGNARSCSSAEGRGRRSGTGSTGAATRARSSSG